MTITLSNDEQSPHILVLGMGGTIAGLAPSPESNPLFYQAGQVNVGDLLTNIETALPEGLKIVSRQVANINSSNLSEALLTQLGDLVRSSLANTALIGIVVTHGTDTIEETSLFLHATCGKYAGKLSKRIVLTGAMLPSNAPGADGPSNLINAIRWVSKPVDQCPGGVFAVFAGNVCMARDLAKRHSSELNAPLRDSPCSPLDSISQSWLDGVKAIQAVPGDDLPIPREQAWPWVEILTSHVGARSETIQNCLSPGVEGLVISGTGQGGFSNVWKEPLDKAIADGIALVRSTRAGAGIVRPDLPEKDTVGCMASGSLSAPKARIALQLAINAAKEKVVNTKNLQWQDFFVMQTLQTKSSS